MTYNDLDEKIKSDPEMWRKQEHARLGMTDDLLDRIRAYRSAPDVYYAPEPEDMEARILADAEVLKAADELAEVAEACLRMMDDVLKGTGMGDMAIKPDHSMSLIDGWKRHAAYRKARGEL